MGVAVREADTMVMKVRHKMIERANTAIAYDEISKYLKTFSHRVAIIQIRQSSPEHSCPISMPEVKVSVINAKTQTVAIKTASNLIFFEPVFITNTPFPNNRHTIL